MEIKKIIEALGLTSQQLKDLAKQIEKTTIVKNKPKRMARVIQDLYFDKEARIYITFAEMIRRIECYENNNFIKKLEKGKLLTNAHDDNCSWSDGNNNIHFYKSDKVDDFIEILESEIGN